MLLWLRLRPRLSAFRAEQRRFQLVVEVQGLLRSQRRAHCTIGKGLGARLCDEHAVDVAADEEHGLVRRPPPVDQAKLRGEWRKVRGRVELVEAKLQAHLWIWQQPEEARSGLG